MVGHRLPCHGRVGGFGVALFNGLPQPWASGVKPDEDLHDNTELTGTVTWSGALLGFSGPSPIAGDAALEVDLTTVGTDGNEQDLSFEDIYFVNRFESDTTDDSDRWFHTRNIDYKVEISGNYFENVTGDDYEQGLRHRPVHGRRARAHGRDRQEDRHDRRVRRQQTGEHDDNGVIGREVLVVRQQLGLEPPHLAGRCPS